MKDVESNRYDAHCHIFTLEYAVKEVKSMLHDMLDGSYPWSKPSSKDMLSTTLGTQSLQGTWSDLKALLQQLYELLRAAKGSEEENLHFLQSEAKKAFPSDGLRIIPLMMDIFYMFAYPINKDKDIQSADKLKMASLDEKLYQDCWNEILDDFTAYVKSPAKALKAVGESGRGEHAERALRVVGDERSITETLKLKSGALKSTSKEGFYQTDGFCYHMNNLLALVKKQKGKLYPFIAIDPRRPGMIDTLLSGRFIKGKERFYGVKLYPRMGYHPQSKPMNAVYKYCNDNNLPIIFHCGQGGFPPSETWKYAGFGNPINFEPVVKKYPNLKIDFAHFGSSASSDAWAKTILRLVNENENVYSDLSCYTDKNTLTKKKKKFWNDQPKLKTRLMFGTDFDVMYFTDKVTMQSYYNNFSTVFNHDELTLLMHDNPKSFMGL
jgi:predicted TIM-barrel fold metal-dependent hydrolase